VALGPDGRVWVSNKGSSSLSVVDPNTLAVTQTVALPRASQPFGVVVAANDGSVFVALEATGRVLKLNSAGSVVVNTDVGPNPRHLALTAASDRLLVSRFITRPQPGEETAVVSSEISGQKQGAEVLVLNPQTLASSRTIVLQHSDKPDTTVSGGGVPNYLGAPVVSPDGQSAWVPSKQDNIVRGLLRNQRHLDFQNTVRAISSRLNLVSEAEDYAARIDHDNSGVASAAAFHPSGAYLFVALETSRHVAVLDAYGERELFRAEAGLAPQAVAVSDDGLSLYVHNALDRSVSVYDLRPLVTRGEKLLPQSATLDSVAAEALSAQVLLGKKLFYDARDTRLARDAYMSCASCHNDGGHDGRTWDLSGAGEGLRNTVNLRGRAGAHGRLHWTANFDEVQDFEGQIRSLAGGTGLMSDEAFNTGTRSQPLGDAKAGHSADLDALAAYVASLSTFEASPYRESNGRLTAEALAGRGVFSQNCIGCHSGSAFTDSAAGVQHDIGTIKPSSGHRLGATLSGLDTATLRDVWATAPYLHDGSATSLVAAIQAHRYIPLSSADLTNVSAFVQQIGNEEAVAPSPQGLLGRYYSGTSFAGPVALTRTETVDFWWGTGAPGPGVGANSFSVRWTGQVIAPATGSYRFRTVSDDGVRLWVNGSQVINNWTNHSSTVNTTGAVSLVAGQRYDIRLDYYESTSSAVIRLLWLRPGSATYSTIPLSVLFPSTP
jgi:YVTN family beta-propeller protein